jgi:hypothetical protein
MFTDIGSLLPSWTEDNFPEKERKITASIKAIWPRLELPVKACFQKYDLETKVLDIYVSSVLLSLNLRFQQNEICKKVNCYLTEFLNLPGSKPDSFKNEIYVTKINFRFTS